MTAGAVLGLLLAIFFVELAPPQDGAVAVITNPFSGRAADVIAAAGGRIIRGGAGAWIAVGIRPGEGGFAQALRAAGAWLVLSPLAAAGCGAAPALQQGPTRL